MSTKPQLNTETYGFNAKSSVFDGLTFSFIFSFFLFVLVQPDESEFFLLSRNLFFYSALFISSMGLGYALNRSGIKTWGEKIFEASGGSLTSPEVRWIKTFWVWQVLFTILIALVVGLYVTEFSLIQLFDKNGFQGAVRIFSELFNPNFEVLPRAVVRMFETLFMAFIATAFAVPIAFVLSFLAAKNIMKHPAAFTIYFLLRAVLNVIRSVESFMWAIIFAVWVGIGPSAGMLALMVQSVASLTKQYSEIIESVSEGPIEGIRSCGANQFQTILYAVIPQVILPHISFTIYRWDINVRMATIVGFVGGGGIGQLLIAYQGQGRWNEVGCIFLVIAVVVLLLDQGSAYIREALK
jgi:phosphonate transport system permease protein